MCFGNSLNSSLTQEVKYETNNEQFGKTGLISTLLSPLLSHGSSFGKSQSFPVCLIFEATK